MNNQNPYSPYHDAIDVGGYQESVVNAYVAKVFGWMFFGLLVTAITSFAVIFGISASPAFAEMINGLMSIFIVVFIVKVIAVGWLSARVGDMNPAVAKAIYISYAVVNGFTFGFVAILFAVQIGGLYTLAMAFGITAVSFGVMAVYGLTTGKDLTQFSSLLTMGLFGIIIAGVANWFIGSSMLDFLICVVGLFIFLGLTAKDTYRIKHQFARVSVEDGTESRLASNLAILGALMLYLNFINMFMFILRLLGRNR